MKKDKKDIGKPLAVLGVLGLISLFLFRGSGSGFVKVRQRERCRLQLTGTGIFHDNNPVESVAKAVDICRRMNAVDAEVKATGDAISGELDKLKTALQAAGFIVFEKLS